MIESLNYFCKEFTWPGTIFSIFVNILSSFIFIFALLYLLKPKIHIVPLIANQDSPFDGSDENVHVFKIINKSLFGAYDVEVRANYYTLQQGENGILNKLFNKIELRTNKINYIKPKKLLKKNYGDHCAQFFTRDDLSHQVKNNSKYVQLQVTARHSLTGLSNIVTCDFVNHTYIKNGFFKTGDNDNIV